MNTQAPLVVLLGIEMWLLYKFNLFNIWRFSFSTVQKIALIFMWSIHGLIAGEGENNDLKNDLALLIYFMSFI